MSEIEIRRLRPADIPAVVALLADDELGAGRETPDELGPYWRAYDRIDIDPNQLLMVAERDGGIVGTLQLSLVPGLSRRGALRAQIEGLRVAGPARGAGLGEQLIRWAVEQARERGCALVQLTSDKQRADAHRFYARLGFEPTHEGFKLTL